MSKIITKVEYDVAGNAFAAAIDLGEIKDDSSNDPEVYEDNKNTRSEVQWAGESDKYKINLFDTTKRADLRAKFIANTRIDVRLTFSDATTSTILSVKPIVSGTPNSFKAGQKAFFTLSFLKYTSV